MIYAGGAKFLLLSALIYAPGTLLFVVARRERNQAGVHACGALCVRGYGDRRGRGSLQSPVGRHFGLGNLDTCHPGNAMRARETSGGDAAFTAG